MPDKRIVPVVICALALGVGLAMAQEEKTPAKEGEQAMPVMAPKPPAENQLLDVFVGKWKETFEFSPTMMPPEGGKGTGISTGEWVLDGWFLKFEMTWDAGEMGQHKGVSYLWYDPQARTYRSWGVDNMGEVHDSTWTYDQDTKTWLIESDSPMMGQPMKHKSTMRLLSPSKLEWEWHSKGEGDEDFKLLMKGTSERIRSE